jgi:FAD-linked sulfhydryl oxidase
MLHRLAAQYDKEPTPEKQRDVEAFFKLLGDFYPCPDCAKHFRGMLAEHPIDARSNRHLSLWLCKLHNNVNVRLGKPLFPCELDALKDRWGSCGCFDANNATQAAATAPS